MYLRAVFPSTSPWGAYIWRGDLTEGFLRYRFEGLIFGGAYTWRGLFSEFYGTYPAWQAFERELRGRESVHRLSIFRFKRVLRYVTGRRCAHYDR